jgi:P27 family predicted phage terminase small subunit
MTKGRKRIPSKIIDLRGGTAHTHRPPRDQEPKPPEKMPPCPKHLDKDAKKEWRRSGKVLKAIGLLTDLDMMILAAYCEAYSRWVYAVKNVAEMGMVRIGKEGQPVINPYLRIAREAYDQMIRAGTQIGMSPSSRASLKVENPKPKSKAEEFRGRKNNGTKD